MATVRQNKEEMVTKAGLKTREWTEAGIRKFLGEPDEQKANPHYKSAAPMSLYRLTRVEEVEKTPEYVAWRVGSEKRRRAAVGAVATKRASSCSTVAGWTPRIPVISQVKLRRRAIASYNCYQSERATWGRGYREWTPATESSDAEFLDRISVNYIRHELTDYDGLLESLHGKVGLLDAKRLVRRQVYDAIAAVYPDLAAECAIQEERRVIEDLTGKMQANATR